MNAITKLNTEKLDALVEKLNEEGRRCHEYAESEDSCLAEFCSDLGYNEGEYDTSNLTPETEELLNRIPEKLKRKAVLECSSVELVGMRIQDNEVFNCPIGEQEHQLPDELAAETKALTKEEYEYVVRHFDEAYLHSEYRDLIYTNHSFDRFVLILDEDKLERWIKKNVRPESISKRKQKLQDYMENECAFRSYRFVSAKQWGKKSYKASINLLNPNKRDIDDALSVFSRDGYSQIVIYLGRTK